jgi:hypothetical protein
MDAFYNGFFDKYLETHEDAYGELSDFVYFNNMSTMAMNTSMSMPYLLTAGDIDFTIGLQESNEKAWHGNDAELFYSTLHDNGFVVNVYSDSDEYLGNAENMVGKVDNLGYVDYEIRVNKWKTFFKLSKLSLYKYLPVAFKEFFYVSDSQEINECSDYLYKGEERSKFDDSFSWTDVSTNFGICMYNFDYWAGLKKGLRTGDSDKKMVFQHIIGMHKPYYALDGKESVYSSEEETEICMTILFEYIRQLKEMGLYDNSTIVVIADHGEFNLHTCSPITLVKAKNAKGERLQINSAPGMSQADLLPTIMDLLGYDYTGMEDGESLFDLGETQIRERILRQCDYRNDYPPVPKCKGSGFSVYNSYTEYRFKGRTEEIDVMKDKYKEGPITDYWW